MRDIFLQYTNAQVLSAEQGGHHHRGIGHRSARFPLPGTYQFGRFQLTDDV